MNTTLCVLSVLLSAAVIFLAAKLLLMKKAARELRRQFEDRLKTESNSPMGISSGDADMRKLAETMNRELAGLKKLRHRYAQGDAEVKKAVTNISHDLRTPLTAISGYLDLLKKEEKSETAERYLEIIENRAAAMKSLTEEMFLFSVAADKSVKPKIAPTDIRALIEQSLAENYTLLSGRGITPDVRLPERLTVETDAKMLLRVFGNVISNAAKYSDGDFTVRADESGTVSFSNSAKALSAVEVSRLFDRFFTVNEGKRSTGLGLSIAKELTERLGSGIGAQYENGVLTVTVRL